MKNHKGHSILGNYCWNCQQPTVIGLPGWPKASKNDGPREIDPIPSIVIWADGTEDTERECSICNTQACKIPVHKEEYNTALLGSRVAGTMALELATYDDNDGTSEF